VPYAHQKNQMRSLKRKEERTGKGHYGFADT
jgi:hypothetical protein